jgi:hypothetical protein
MSLKKSPLDSRILRIQILYFELNAENFVKNPSFRVPSIIFQVLSIILFFIPV